MIPRTDQYRQHADGSIGIQGPDTQQDRVRLLLESLDEFLIHAATLQRDADDAYIVHDSRAGKTGAVRHLWHRVHRAASMVLSSTLQFGSVVPQTPDIAVATGAIRPSDAGIGSVAWSLVNALNPGQLESRIPADAIERIKRIQIQLEKYAMPDHVERIRALQRTLHQWLRETPGAREWVEKKILPALRKMWEEQRSLPRFDDELQADLEKAGREEIDSEKQPNKRPPRVYDREADPCHMSATTIGRLRDEGNHELANLAEAFFVVMLHDSGEAGTLDKLFPQLVQIRGLSRSFDWAYFNREHTGLEVGGTPPRFSPEAIEGMLERFKARFRPEARSRRMKGKRRKANRADLGPRPLTEIERETFDTVTRNGGNVAAAAKELGRDPKTVRENLIRAQRKLEPLTGSRSVSGRSQIPRDRRGNVILPDAESPWLHDDGAFVMPDEE